MSARFPAVLTTVVVHARNEIILSCPIGQVFQCMLSGSVFVDSSLFHTFVNIGVAPRPA